ncbi:CLUMA_CG003842, isoform A [Clunio marinus]|uniref:CLUMA_CG003842, isoform A n=1 Tax=Clunio marinus TaxID=568069 RepID=A0A1J1HRW1_9DIPT|nr:CLUMA_CG003842, isoform A [Clunio marinus]
MERYKAHHASETVRHEQHQQKKQKSFEYLMEDERILSRFRSSKLSLSFARKISKYDFDSNMCCTFLNVEEKCWRLSRWD